MLIFLAIIYAISTNLQTQTFDENLSLNSKNFIESKNQVDINKTDQNNSTKNKIEPKQKEIKNDINHSNYNKNIPSMQIQKQELAEQNLSEFFKILDENENFYKNISKENNITTKIDNKKNENLIQKPQKLVVEKTIKKINKQSKYPLLAIIIDDVSTFSQADLIKKINLKLTPSIFPVSTNTPHTDKIASKFKFYMIHLPMSAINYKNEEPNTMHINDSEDLMLKRIKKIKKDFSNIKFINNHTGSEFTSNIQALDKLMSILKSQNIILLDSKTTSKSKVEYLSKKYNMPYLYRDVFLDNIRIESEIKKQLQNAINIAKKRGYAIAIGHPYDVTLKTISKNINMLNDVEVVYVDRLYKEIYGYNN